MDLLAQPTESYLGADEVIDWHHPAVRDLADRLRAEAPDPVRYAEQAFHHVRDRVRHSWDAQDPTVALSASEVLRAGVALCYGKAHLLAALLRARGIPAGLCYQRLVDDEGRFALHGLVALHLAGRWSRLDPRGNKPGVDAQFSLDVERLAWVVRPELGEVDHPSVLTTADPAVVAALSGTDDVLALCARGLPDALTGQPGQGRSPTSA